MGRKLLTIEDLIVYCSSNNLTHFSAAKADDELIVSLPATFTKDKEFDSEFFAKGRCRSCHDKLNINKSYIDTKTIKEATPSFAYKPVLASIISVKDDDGNETLDFNGHDMVVADDKMHQGEKRIEYIEQIVGVVPSTNDNNLELKYEEATDKTYVDVDVLIFKDYTYAWDILEKRQGAEVSVELSVSEFSYNVKEKYLLIIAFKLSGITLLGKSVKPGMVGSNVSFSLENTPEDKVFEVKLQSMLDSFMTQFDDKLKKYSEKGGKQNLKLDELLSKYNKTIEDITFDYEELNDIELEAKFVEMFTEDEQKTETTANAAVGKQNEGASEFTASAVETVQQLNNITITNSAKEKESTISVEFKLSHEDIRYGLYQLLSGYNELDNDYYVIRTVYDDSFVMIGWCTGKNFGQKYTTDKATNTVQFEGERWELFEELLTTSEKLTLDEMRSNYAAQTEKLATYQAKEIEAEVIHKKMALMSVPAYEDIKETTEFMSVLESANELTVEEMELKADLLLGQFTKNAATVTKPIKKSFVMSLQTSKPIKESKSSFIETLQNLGKGQTNK